MTKVMAIGFLLAGVGFEGVSHLFFKLATKHDHHGGSGLLSLWHTMKNPMIALGIASFVVNMAFYTMALQRLDLSVAFPAEGLTLIVVVVLSRICLRERISRRRWVGILLVLAGGVVVGMS